jgi:hypothetical protein
MEEGEKIIGRDVVGERGKETKSLFFNVATVSMTWM